MIARDIGTISRLSAPLLPETLARDRLIDGLAEAGAHNRPSWICGPPGAGKTTLAASYIERVGMPCLWYELDVTDADPAAFFTYLAKAADVADRGVGDQLPRMTADHLQGLPTFTREFCEALYRLLPVRCVLVFDNVQEIPAGSPVEKLLPQILGNARTGQHVILVSREPPPRALARLRANRGLQLLEWDDLRFTRTESQDMLALRGMKDLDAAREVVRASAGWAAGLILMCSEDNIAQGGGANAPDYQLIFDYFALEATRRMPEEHLDDVIRTAVFEDFDADMAATLCKGSPARMEAIFSDLHARQFFTQRRHQQAPRYRFHPLFRRYLLAELQRRYSDAFIAGHKRFAAAIARRDGQFERAARLAIEGRDWPELASLCLERAAEMIRSGRHKELLAWLDALPLSTIGEHTWLTLWHGCALFPYSPSRAASEFQKAYETFKALGDTSGRFLAWACAVELISFEWNDFVSAPYWVGELEDMLECSDYPSFELECRIVLALLPLLIWAEGSTARFPKLIDRCMELLHQVRDPSIRASLAGGICYFHQAVSGDVQAAARLVDSFHADIVQSDAIPSAKLYWYAQCGAHWLYSGQYSTGLSMMQDGFRLIDDFGLRVLSPIVTSWTAMIHATAHEGDKADAAIRKMKSNLVPGRRVEQLLYLYTSSFRRFQLDASEANKTALEEGYKLSVQTNAAYPKALFTSALCYCYLELGETERAQDFLEKYRVTSLQQNSPIAHFSQLLLEAEFARHSGDDEPLRRALTTAMRYGKRQRILGFAGQVQPTVRLYALALQYGIEEAYVTRVISQLRLRPDPGLPLPSNWPWPVRITTLGRLAIERDGSVATDTSRQRRVLELLALLIVEHEKPLSKERIKLLLWPEAESDKAEQNLKSTVRRLRTLLGSGAIEWRSAELMLDKRQIWVDCWEIEAALKSIPKNNAGIDIGVYERVRELYGGPVLPTEDHCWLLPYRELLHRKCCSAFVGRAQTLVEEGRFEQAIDLAGTGQEIDPTVEGLYQAQMKAYLGRGNVSHAVKTYRSCVGILKRALGTMPSPTTTSLISKYL